MVNKLTSAQQKEVKKEVEQQLRKYSSLFQKAKQPVVFFSSRFKDQLTTAIIAAIGIILALTWKDVISLYLQSFKSDFLEKYPYLSSLYTALIVTVIAVVILIFLSKLSKKSEQA